MAEDDLIPRNYQLELMKIALEKNTIIFLPTGSGKTFIALLVLKRMSGDLMESYGNGGKITVLVVNTVALVDQHAKCIRDRTSLNVGCYTGDMNLDFWPKTQWYAEFDKHQVFVMTVQILVNLVNQNFLDLNKINLLIFDECHRGVSDQPMRQLCKSFQNLSTPPRVLGLTATLLNGNCSPSKVMQEVQALETTYHSKVATVDGLEGVVGFSTNPKEEFKICFDHNSTSVDTMALKCLANLRKLLHAVKVDQPPVAVLKCDLLPLDKKEGLKKLINNIADVEMHIQVMGTYGGVKAILVHLIQIERLKKHCQDPDLFKILSNVSLNLTFVMHILEKSMEGYDDKTKIEKFSSNKVLNLISIFDEYQILSREELCSIIFTKRRFTAKIIYHILDSLRNCDSRYEHIKPNFMVGYNNNPYNDTRESLYTTKKNKEILQSFANKEINVLVASNVLEEGVDIPKCTLVVKFDKPEDYRSYIQSKGRARHKSSFYYMIVENSDSPKFFEKYTQFQLVEKILNEFLIGKNDERADPSQQAIEKMYIEDKYPPYYVDGPNSAHVNMVSAIPLLCQYCNSIPSDQYTTYAPELFYKKNDLGHISITILMPIPCPLVDLIEGPFLLSTKLAKRAAALKACEMLHKCGELDDHLLPKRRTVLEEDVSFLFKHYPTVKEPKAGNNKNKRLHNKEIAACLKGQIKPGQTIYLHVIELIPCFEKKEGNISFATMYDMYTSPLCFGVITPNPLPIVCDFPIYVTQGTINVSLKVNSSKLVLSEQDIQDIKEFHVLVLADVLRVLRPFLIFDLSEDAEMAVLVPVDKSTNKIDFDILREHKTIKNVYELTRDEKLKLEVGQENYLRKIVSPWYRDSGYMVVVEVSLNKSALSPFPNEEFGTFVDYFQDKHNLFILNPSQPLLLVKELSKKLNYFKPKSIQHKRKREQMYEEMDQHLIPELVVKQDFPASLWIQASFLPTILSRLTYLCQLEELRCKIAKEARLGKEIVLEKQPLKLDTYLINYEANIAKPNEANVTISHIDECDSTIVHKPLLRTQWNKDFAVKMLESEYPWRDIDEPKDLERCLDVTILDIEHYEAFICQKVSHNDVMLRNEKPMRIDNQLALTYPKEFVEKSIKLLENHQINEGPELCELYRAFTTAKSNDIVNLERLETLGDSLLKFIASVYIAIRFPEYDEGRATSLKSRMVSNKNLFYLAQNKNFGGIMKYHELAIQEWLPPGFRIPDIALQRINNKEISLSSLFHFNIPVEEQVSGNLSFETTSYIFQEDSKPEEGEEDLINNVAPFFKGQYIGDKQVADVVESLLGAYFQSSGLDGSLKLIEWLDIIPGSEKLRQLLVQPCKSPRIKFATQRDIDFHIPNWMEIENILGYHFQDRAYLLQALTHPSYTPNRITHSYEKLEFVGDAILDFLITCYIYESCGNLNPGELTDLRSALVNNNTFASLVVKCSLHKCILLINMQLQSHIDKFAQYFASKKFQIDEEVLILLEEDELNLAEYIDVPKALGDVFEALAGAIYLDSKKDLAVVWKVFYKIMWKEIDLFSSNVPKNVIRRLYEYNPCLYPKFEKSVEAGADKTMVPLNFILDGHPKRVYGFGTNKSMAKKAAAKLALRSLEK